MDVHLMSTPGESGAEYVVAAVREILAQAAPSKRKPRLAYLPAASLGYRWVKETREYFRELAAVAVIDVDRHSRTQIEATLDRSDLLYIPGGNTYWMAHRLNRTCRPGGLDETFINGDAETDAELDEPLEDIMEAATALIDSNPLVEPGGEDSLMASLRRRVLAGLPLVGFSAGAVLCGPEILTTNDINPCGCTCFSGLGLLPFYINPHYPKDPEASLSRQKRLQEFLQFHPSQVILALEDGSYLRAAQGEIHVVHGRVWKIEHNQEAVPVQE